MIRKRSRKSGQVSKGTPEKWSQSQTVERRNEAQKGLTESKGVKRFKESHKRRGKTSVVCDVERICLVR